MAITVAVIAQGEMGAGIGERLHAHGARVLTSLQGRSTASAERAAKAGMEPMNDDARLVAEADFLMSVIPPGEAVPFARRFAPAIFIQHRDGGTGAAAAAAEIADHDETIEIAHAAGRFYLDLGRAGGSHECEVVLGGFTQRILNGADLPVLMAH